MIRDLFEGGKTVRSALARFRKEGRGVIALLRDGAAGVPMQAIPRPGDTRSDAARVKQWREIGLGAQILKELVISSMRPSRCGAHDLHPHR